MSPKSSLPPASCAAAGDRVMLLRGPQCWRSWMDKVRGAIHGVGFRV